MTKALADLVVAIALAIVSTVSAHNAHIPKKKPVKNNPAVSSYLTVRVTSYAVKR